MKMTRSQRIVVLWLCVIGNISLLPGMFIWQSIFKSTALTSYIGAVLFAVLLLLFSVTLGVLTDVNRLLNSEVNTKYPQHN